MLSRQHYINFSQRLNAFGIEVKELSRFIKPSEKKKIYFDIENGKADVIIGTHSLLNDKINFKKLGLIIYDEEQKLGTLQKEKFKVILQLEGDPEEGVMGWEEFITFVENIIFYGY